MKTDEELRKEFQIKVEDNNIVSLTYLVEEKDPESSTRLAEIVSEEVMKILEQNPNKKYYGLIDLSSLEGRVSYLADPVRQIYARIMGQEQISRIAIVSANLFYKIAVDFIVKVAGKIKNAQWFATRAEALAWLAEKDKSPIEEE